MGVPYMGVGWPAMIDGIHNHFGTPFGVTNPHFGPLKFPRFQNNTSMPKHHLFLKVQHVQ